MGSGQWVVDSGQWAMDNGQWAVDGGHWAVGSGAWAVLWQQCEILTSQQLERKQELSQN